MISSIVERELRECLHSLPLEQQREVLAFARALASARVRGVRGTELLQFAGAIAADDLTAMAQAIEDACEQVDPNEW